MASWIGIGCRSDTVRPVQLGDEIHRQRTSKRHAIEERALRCSARGISVHGWRARAVARR
jgi:hypothetical protein